MNPVPPDSSDADIEAFFDVIEALARFDDSAQGHFADGWMTALACTGRVPPAEAWINGLFGDTFERVFADPPSRQAALAPLLARMRVIQRQLDAEALLEWPDRMRLAPIIDTWSVEELAEFKAAAAREGGSEQIAVPGDGSFWAEGFISGSAAYPDLWPDTDDEVEDEAFMAVAALTFDPDSADWREHLTRFYPNETPDRDSLITDALWAVQELRLWHANRPAPAMEPIRAEAKPGRNDPCFCGSGKKYKKCHGAG